MKLSAVLLMPAFLFVSQCNSPKPVETKLESAQQNLSIKKNIENGALVVDVRTPEEFEAGSYPGAVNIPLDEVKSRLEEFKNKPGVVVFCKTGNRSGQAIRILEAEGIQNISNGINTENMEKEMK